MFNRFRTTLLCVFVAAQTTLLLVSLRLHSVTVDEPGHVAAGVANLCLGTFEPYLVNPPLYRVLAALPVVAANPTLPDPDYLVPIDPGGRVEMKYGSRFAIVNQNCYLQLIRLARLMGIAWALLGAWVVYHWAQELYGGWAGCLSLSVWCFEPNLLAHAQLATPDFPATVAAGLAAYFFWRYLKRPGWSSAWLAGLTLGLAQLTKFTLVVLYPIDLILWLLWFSLRARNPRGGADRKTLCGHALLLVGLSIGIINVGYVFDGTGQLLGEVPFVSCLFTGRPDGPLWGETANRWRGTCIGQLPLPVPTPYLRGIDLQRRDLEGSSHDCRLSYLAGHFQVGGWWYYYLYALAVKVPLGLWVLALSGFGLAMTRRYPWRDELAVYLPVAAILVLASSQTGFSRHARYVLPLIPFVLVSLGKLAGERGCQRSWSRLLIAAMVLWATCSSLLVYPHSLSYFNELGGGPRNGSNHLLNSNIDWGQDLLFLKRWRDEHPETHPLGIACPHVPSAALAGLESWPPIPEGPGDAPPEECGPRPGYFAVNVHYLRGMPYPYPAHTFEYFNAFQPIDRIGYSYYIFHITPEQANAARERLGLPFLNSAAPSLSGMRQPNESLRNASNTERTQQ